VSEDGDGRLLARDEKFNGKIIRVSVDEVRLPNGNVAAMEMVRHVGAAAVVPLDANGDVLLVRQYRYAAGGWLLEIPAGKLEPGEPPEDCAVREVEEEVGVRPEDVRPLGWIWTAPGFTDEKIRLYLATGLKPARQALENDEVLSVVRVPLERAVGMALSGEISDAKSVAGLLRAKRALRDDRDA
jgi:ADP-ribose pyrophosphatase